MGGVRTRNVMLSLVYEDLQSLSESHQQEDDKITGKLTAMGQLHLGDGKKANKTY